MSDMEEMFKSLQSCCLHDPVWLPADVQREIRWHGDRQTGSESSSIIIVRLKPAAGQRFGGDYGLLTQSEDYTGHGCQCGSFTARDASLKTLLGHLDDMDLITLIERSA